ncbi:MAG: DUF305 domain-containing protein [Fimbriimonas sp.]
MNGHHDQADHQAHADHGRHEMRPKASRPEIAAVTLLSVVILALGVLLSNWYGNLAMSTRNMREQMTFDRRYIDMMVPHHQAAVEMAEIALKRSKRPEIRELAQNVIRSQSEEISLMKGWRKAWYGSDRTPPLSQMPMIMEGMQMMNDVPMDMQGDLEVLQRSPGDFDRAFIDAMIPHHGSAVEASAHAPTLAVHQEIVDLAATITRDQEKEIAQMRKWRSTWYPGH